MLYAKCVCKQQTSDEQYLARACNMRPPILLFGRNKAFRHSANIFKGKFHAIQRITIQCDFQACWKMNSIRYIVYWLEISWKNKKKNQMKEARKREIDTHSIRRVFAYRAVALASCSGRHVQTGCRWESSLLAHKRIGLWAQAFGDYIPFIAAYIVVAIAFAVAVVIASAAV